MNKKLIRKKLRNSRARVHYYALDPLKQTLRGFKHHVESSNLSLNNLASQNTRQIESLYNLSLANKDTLDDISLIQESIRDIYSEFYFAFKERTVTIITALLCISVALAALLFIILFV